MKHAFIAFLISATAAQAHAFAGCSDGAFVNANGDTEIGINGRGYTPKCLRVKAGTTITVQASDRHPLQGVGQDNPLFDPRGGSESTKTVTFNTPGFFGYFCVDHGDSSGEGMAGAILVE